MNHRLLVIGCGAAPAVIEVLLVFSLLAGVGLIAFPVEGTGSRGDAVPLVVSLLASAVLLVVVLGILLLLTAWGRPLSAERGAPAATARLPCRPGRAACG